MAAIDLNADLGETVDGRPTADDEAMFAVISSANVACGGHAGDATSMRDAVDRAHRFGVAVGAHPSYPDRANFGRVPVAIAAGPLQAVVEGQLEALAAAGADVRYVKPHGALYHAVTADVQMADAVARAVAAFSARAGRPLPLLGLGGQFARAAASVGLPFVYEAFLDRAYLADGTLVPRTQPGAVLDDPAAAAARAVQLARDGVVEAADGTSIAVTAASLCVHGDSPAAVAMARAVRAALDAEGVEVRAPW
ncbi:5-oxoprolinase subunit PxpA [Microbacterium cremeum]|uniref:5-oxoprolinase subunit PxpA n=1 Tax=Microbacterium cremeum TaxID=2782169 RepID=UPI0018890EAE|nr:5-oxoprolinase subunit PxpA [Microbacterium cremeum]